MNSVKLGWEQKKKKNLEREHCRFGQKSDDDKQIISQQSSSDLYRRSVSFY